MENTKTNSAPVLRVPGTLLLPDTILKLKNLSLDNAGLLVQDAFVAINAEDNFFFTQTAREYGHLMGVLCTASELKADEDEENSYSLTINTLYRVRVESIQGSQCTFTEDAEEDDLNEQSKEEILEFIKDQVREMASSFQGGRHISRRADGYSNLNQLIAYLAQYMSLSAAEKYELLEISSMHQRCTRFIDWLMRQKQTIALALEMNEKFSRQASDYYRRQALKRQLEAIQDELNEGQPEAEDKDSYASRIEAMEADEAIKKALLEDAKRLESGPGQGMDAEVLKNYLEFALALPWKKEPAFQPDLEQARAILDERHYGLDKVKERIVEHLAVMQLRNSSKGSAILLVGPPGTGKTSLGKSIAKALCRPYARMALGGIRDESEIRGHRRTYVGAMAGRVLKAMKTAGQTNPVIILDELDKMMAGGFSGDPSAAMLEVLDPEQNDTFTDHYLDLPYDLSDVMFIATANSLDTIPAPLLDRMEIIELSSYTPSEKLEIARRHLLPETLEDHGIEQTRLELSDEVLETIISDYTMEAGCRGLKKRLARIARANAVRLAKGEPSITVTAEDLPEIFGPIARRHERVKESNPCGVVTGLAWTAVGGEVLYIEAASMPGTGQMITTGQLGDVMKESVRISYSVLKSRLPLDALAFKERDIHVHFPAGATPKDGPSAGITIFTALASLALQQPVDSHIAMTGELSLSGRVLPIGGLKEKLSGALRAGITKVLIPWDNRQDLAEVSEEVKQALTIIPVKTVDEVLAHTLSLSMAPMPGIRLAADNAVSVL